MRRLLQHRRPNRVVRRLLQSGRASSSALPLLRLPTVLFPSQPLSLRLTPSDAEPVGCDPLSLQAPDADRVEGEPLSLDAPGMSLPAELVSCAWRDFDGKVVAVSCGHVGVELHLLADHTLDACRLGLGLGLGSNPSPNPKPNPKPNPNPDPYPNPNPNPDPDPDPNPNPNPNP